MSVPSQRIRAKSILLTYPHFDTDPVQLQDELWRSVTEWEPMYMVTAKEFHQDGEAHFHVFIHCAHAIHIKKNEIRMFDIPHKEKNEHGEEVINVKHCNIQSVKSPKDAIRYCKKYGQFITKGVCPFSDCVTTKEKNDLLKSKPLSELVEDGDVSIFKIPQLAKAKQIIQNELLQNRKRDERPKVSWFYGPTGSGKTREAVRIGEENFKGDYWLSNQNGSWFDGYTGQKCVIIDDIRSNTWDFSQLLRITDRYSFRVPVKGSFVPWRPEAIIITAPGTPSEVYSNHSTGETFDGIEQLLRRIDEQIEFPRDRGDGSTTEPSGGDDNEEARHEQLGWSGFI